jgi:uncharacterized protein DUF5318
MARMSKLRQIPRGLSARGAVARPGGRRRRGALGVVDYTLAKRALLREFRSGLLSRLEICDAHPELIRAAKNMGTQARRPCPVCRQHELRLLAYVYAEGLQHQNGRPYDVHEAIRLAASHAGAAYVVEVCTDCNWNHLAEAVSVRTAG